MIVTEQPGDEHYTIRPSEIALTPAGAVQGGFGKQEIEMIAGHLIRFFQEKEAWSSFTLDELTEFFSAQGWGIACPLYGLTGYWEDWGDETPVTPAESNVFVVSISQYTYAVTDQFIERCKEAT